MTHVHSVASSNHEPTDYKLLSRQDLIRFANLSYVSSLLAGCCTLGGVLHQACLGWFT